MKKTLRQVLTLKYVKEIYTFELNKIRTIYIIIFE